jgi:hypothetical protein
MSIPAQTTAPDGAKHGRPPLGMLALLLAFPSLGFVQKYTGLAGAAAYVALVIGMVFLIAMLSKRAAPWLRRHFQKLAALSILGLAAGFVVLHPIEDDRGPGKSNDRDEGLEMAVTRMARGETPYYPSNRIAGPLSVLPGSMFLAAPFVALGNSGYQNVFWLAAFLIAACAYFKDKAAALYLLAVPLGLSLAAQYEFVSGGDLIANGIFVALFFLFALQSWSVATTPAWQRWLACLLLGVGLASRANFILLLLLFGAAMWQLAGWRNAVTTTALVGMTAATITLPFYLHDPAGFTPLLTRQKLAGVDHVLPWASKAMIGASVLVSVLGAWVLWRRESFRTIPLFFRCCTWVTLTPIVAAVLFSSWISGSPDFSFLHDRFGLMYVFFAILGWGGALLGDGCEPEATANGKEI